MTLGAVAKVIVHDRRIGYVFASPLEKIVRVS
jgi:hypothetical protein